MSGRQSPKTEQALALVAGGLTRYAAAKRVGIDLSTVYRAWKQKETAPTEATVKDPDREVQGGSIHTRTRIDCQKASKQP